MKGKGAKTKDFKKQIRKVGRKQTASNETYAAGVRGKRILMPVQRIDGSPDGVLEHLVGLKHYNDRKRLDAINNLLRSGVESLAANHIGEVLLGLGFGLSDEDEQVRTKCGAFLFAILNGVEATVLQPFASTLFIQLRTALANVRTEIRGSSVHFLSRLRCDGLFSEIETRDLIRALVELNSAVVPRGRSKSDETELRSLVCKCVENLLEALVEKQQETETGQIDRSQWTVSSIANRAVLPESTLGLDMRKLVNSLERQGLEILAERIKLSALSAGLISIDAPKIPSDPKRGQHSRGKNTVSIFSRMSQLMREDSD